MKIGKIRIYMHLVGMQAAPTAEMLMAVLLPALELPFSWIFDDKTVLRYYSFYPNVCMKAC
jgi:hypothetical protein